jgi:hypothetical protein
LIVLFVGRLADGSVGHGTAGAAMKWDESRSPTSLPHHNVLSLTYLALTLKES